MELKDKIIPFLKEHYLSLVLGIIGFVFLGYGLLHLVQPTQENNDFQIEQEKPVVRSNVSPVVKQITVDIEGSVQKPGVYALPANSRMQDALIASGGLSQNADRQKVTQTINLAAPLTDGAKIYIPAVGEQYAGSSESSGEESGSVGGATTVNINQASESDLDALPGVGPVTAQKIISNRPYQSTQELLDKKIVGQSEFVKIKDQVSLY